MARILRVFLLLLVGWGILSLHAQDSLPPAPTQWVTDGPSQLSPEVRSRLNARLAAFESTTGHQVLLWIGTSTEGVPLEDWAARTFEAWGVGRKGLDNGLALFVLTGDRKLRIEVGYGLEGQMPDALASRIIRETIAPRLASGDWDTAMESGVDQILSTLGGEGNPSAGPPARTPAKMGCMEWVVLLVLGLGFLVLLATHPTLAISLLFSILSGGRGGGRSSGGGWSGGGGRSGGGGASGSW